MGEGKGGEGRLGEEWSKTYCSIKTMKKEKESVDIEPHLSGKKINAGERKDIESNLRSSQCCQLSVLGGVILCLFIFVVSSKSLSDFTL